MLLPRKIHQFLFRMIYDVEIDLSNEDDEPSSIEKKAKTTSKRKRKKEIQDGKEERSKQYDAALQDYENNPGISFWACAKKHKVNNNTLKKLFESGNRFKGSGKELTVLTKEEEKKLCEHIVHLLKLGYSLTFPELRCLIQEALIRLCQANPDRTSPWEEENHLPTGNFVYAFAARHNLVLRSTMELSKARSMLSLETLLSWFRDTAGALVNHPDFEDCWSDARRILNQDECGIQEGREGSDLRANTKSNIKPRNVEGKNLRFHITQCNVWW